MKTTDARRPHRAWLLCACVAVLASGFLSGDVVSLVRAQSAAINPAVSIDLQASRAALDPGMAITYTITLANSGGADAAGARLLAPLPIGIDSMRWTCAADGGARCPRASGDSDIDQSITSLPAGGSLRYRVDARVAARPPTWVTNAVEVQLPPGVTCADKQTAPCRARVDLPAGPRVALSSRSSVAAPAPGEPFAYTLTVRNAGTVDAAGTIIRDPVPVGLAEFDWSCAGSACPRNSGSGSLHEAVTHFPAGSSLTYTISAKSVADPPARITQMATANPPYGGSCGDGDNIHLPPCVAATISPAGSGRCGTAGSPPCAPPSTPTPDGSVPQIGIDKYNLNGSAGAGDSVQYIVFLQNIAANAAANGTVLTDDLPAGIASFDSWTCSTVSGNVQCPNSAGSGAINETLDLPPSSSVEYMINATVDSSPPTYITNVATATPPVGTGAVCGDGSQPPCSYQDMLPTVPVIDVGKFLGIPGSPNGATESSPLGNGSSTPPGSNVAYTVSVYNGGADLPGGLPLTISDPVPAGLDNVTWTCSAFGGGQVGSNDPRGFGCPNTSGSGDINEVVTTLPNSYELDYIIMATVDANPPGSITNIVTVTPPSGSICFDGSTPPCSAQVVTYTRPTVSVAKTADQQQLVPGGVVTYTVTVGNSGDDANGTVLRDPVPSGIDQFSWTCTGFGTQCPADSGTGGLVEQFGVFPAGAQAVYTITAPVSQDAVGSVTNIANVTPIAGGVCEQGMCDAALTIPVAPVPMANLTVTKTADVTEAIPGQPITYTIQVTNIGDAAAIDTVLADPLPTGLSGFDWTCTSSTNECPNASGSGDINETIPMLTGEVTYQATALVDRQPPPPAMIVNVATITPMNGATCDQDVCTATSSVPTGMPGAAQIDLTKTTQDQQATPGGQVSYFVSISNSGQTDAGAVTVVDPIPTGLTQFTWTCSGDGAICPNPSGTGAINQTIATLPVNGFIGYNITATVSPTPPPNVTNTATATPADGMGCTATSCTSSVTLPTGTTGTPQIMVTKSTQATEVFPGGQVQYSVQVRNSGTADTAPVLVTDPIPTGLTAFSWTCVGAGVTCPSASGTGAISETLRTLPAGANVNYTINADVAANPPASVTNTATASPSNGAGCQVPSTCTSSVTLPVGTPPVADIVVNKVANVTSLTPGGQVFYTVSVANQGDGDAGAIQVSDPIPAGISAFAWTCSPASSCANASGSGSINELIGSLPASGQVVYSINATVATDASGNVTNTATALPSDPSICSGNNCTSSVTLPVIPPGMANIVVTKTANVGAVNPGGTVTYTVTVANQGDGDAGAIQVSDPIPSGITTFAWTCTGLSCPAASGNGAVNQTLSGLPSGALVTYTITATVAANASSSVTNTATATPSDGVGCMGTNCTASATVSVTAPGTPIIRVTKTANVPNGASVQPGQDIRWTLTANNSGTPSTAVVTLSDQLPTMIDVISISADAGVQCSPAQPAAGQQLVCAVAAGYTGTRRVSIDATVATDASGVLRNSVVASGADQPVCSACSVSNPVVPVGPGIDVALGNARAFSAAGIDGNLFDVVNLGGDVPVTVTLSPAANVSLFGGYAAQCTADDGGGGTVVVICPDPPPMQGVTCSGATCSIASLPQGATITLFAAPTGNSMLTAHANAAGDGNPDNDMLDLPPPGPQ
ncbi:MAG: DUF11 domain-containing protein [Rhodanobacteraceae bacterium]